eukprot:TRINITY_DN31208_c0_g1_i1.p1 TRINITY_DN31208_c0_g1~~TRINITY_DN31208_c0_g1_i1.p1  ORF type:complete len:370 (-),score=90.24 TRINITY_DN31208_c0_g1_i1:31-1140(-)
MALAQLEQDEFAEQERQFRAQYDCGENVVLGEGTYGKVVRARRRQNSEPVAMKQMKLGAGSEEGVPSTAIREIAILRELNHANIVRLIDVFCKPGELVLVFELLDSDLKKHMKGLAGKLEPHAVKDFCRQLLNGLDFCHSSRIMHRDLKPQNLLISGGRTLKIADFGLARAFALPCPEYTHEVITVWYRPLEILLGSKLYSVPVDIWGVGCILGEMATGAPLFAGDSEIDTAFKIFQKLGTPTEAGIVDAETELTVQRLRMLQTVCREPQQHKIFLTTVFGSFAFGMADGNPWLQQIQADFDKAIWPGLGKLPDFKPTFPKWPPRGWTNIRNTLAQVEHTGIDLLEQLMQYDPRARISARRALLHLYFA